MFKTKGKAPLSVAIIALMIMALLSSCSGEGGSGDVSDQPAPFASTEPADLSGYESMMDYEGESRLVETDVDEVIRLMNDKESFIVFFSYEDCPYCNMIMPYVNEVAEETGQQVGYINTRKDPSWQSNIDIKGYDLVVKYFGDYLQEDENGVKHLYTPVIYCVKNGNIAARHDGVMPEEDIDPDQPLTNSQEEALKETLKEKFETVR